MLFVLSFSSLSLGSSFFLFWVGLGTPLVLTVACFPPPSPFWPLSAEGVELFLPDEDAAPDDDDDGCSLVAV